MPFSLRKSRTLLLHVSFWLVYASFFLYQISFGRKVDLSWEAILSDFSFHMASLLLLCYLNYFVFLPKLLASKDLGAYLLRFLPVFGLGSWLILIGKRFIILNLFPNSSWALGARFAVSVTLTTLLIVVFVGLLRFVEDYIEHEARRTELENANLSSELRFLRAQVNPHFLFNTLNNLYYLAVNQSPQTPEIIAKLAGLMRYLLHDSNHALVSLEKEVEYMRNYLDLERLRLNEEVSIGFHVSGQIESVRVVPMILVTFLENAFKHGINNGVGPIHQDFIDVQLAVKDTHLRFMVSNAKVSEQSKTVTEQSGIGLVNARRRLELGYPGRHTLDIDDTADRYTVTLTLELT